MAGRDFENGGDREIGFAGPLGFRRTLGAATLV